jgi:uncharacterized protein YndB with AHSA1/START domain
VYQVDFPCHSKGAEFGGEGHYVEINAPERLVFTWRWDPGLPELGEGVQRVEVSFIENPDSTTTTVVLVNHGLTEPEEQSHREGWQLSFDNLDQVLPTWLNRLVRERVAF